MKKLDNFVKNTEKLREMILEHPDTPIAILVDPEVCGDDCGLWYAPDIMFSTGEILNCECEDAETLIKTVIKICDDDMLKSEEALDDKRRGNQ